MHCHIPEASIKQSLFFCLCSGDHTDHCAGHRDQELCRYLFNASHDDRAEDHAECRAEDRVDICSMLRTMIVSKIVQNVVQKIVSNII